ncbi:MAG: NfeD family protein [Pyrobaculum sp.]
MTHVVSPSVFGLLGGLLVVLTALGYIPPWLGYPIGGSLLAIYLLVLAAGVKALRDFRRKPPPTVEILGKRGMVVETDGVWAILKIDGVYWRALCESCKAGDVVVITGVTDVGLVAEKT